MALVQSINKPALPNKTYVIIKNLGDNEVYRGLVVGASLRFPSISEQRGGKYDSSVDFYMIELIDRIPNYDYDVFLVVPACVYYVEEDVE